MEVYSAVDLTMWGPLGIAQNCELDATASLTKPQKPSPPAGFDPKTLDELLSATPEQLATCDIAQVNLLCATGMPDTTGMSVEDCIATLDEWTGIVARETSRLMYRFHRDPGEYSLRALFPRAGDDYGTPARLGRQLRRCLDWPARVCEFAAKGFSTDF